MTSDVFFLVVLFVSDLDFAFAFFGHFVSDSVGTVFVVNDLWLDVDLVDDRLLFCVLSVDDLLLLLFWQFIKSLLCLSIQNLIFWDSDVKSLDFNLELITTSCSVGTFSVSGLDDKHSFTVNNVVFEKTWAIADCLVGFGVQEISKVSLSDGHVILSA